ncbi:hypothetical protein HN512_00890 [Candidatus Peregrinibacteria bacterium]|jgi:tRNA G10  N-methylase Trm11|nr:hypothetical protein [Candidatus Peregrinibacteria bacterium]MBT3598375.1 hypothetical protein [Candidatus Peregrinibacteria bacterium]MBT4367523.1 hypothetical protein [Candidatus Peregrinibacteria bacterium]MBT4585275.1 hypothetical protein [Candidatus Peregrinibacteria bacterium]MBT7008988.1 hypothetical protein [Candidatus Peregrinibacteria bacterium]
MPTYAAFLGHQPHISTAELAAVIPGFDIVNTFNKKVITFSSSTQLNSATLDILGGTVIIAEQLSSDNLELKDVPRLLVKEMESVRGKKVTFALRAEGIPPRYVKKLYRECKEAIRKKGRASRYVGNERKAAATVILYDQGMITGKGGLELVLLASKNHFWIGKTIAAQNIDAYSKRDMEKPVRDTSVGLLPPKLAQILLNFGLWLDASDKKPKELKKFKPLSGTVFDPFCGTGVIPMESLIRSCAVLASDKVQKAVTGTEKNLDWIRKEYKILKKDVKSTVWKQDATKPFDLKVLPDCVVTETTLGTPMERRPSQKDVMAEKRENEVIQEAFLRNAAETMPGVPIACTWPVWRTKKEPIFLEKIWKVIEELPYEVVLPIKLENHARPTLFYRRSDQFVGREIVLLKPTK